MAFETIQGMLQQTRLINESPEYLARREELRLAEIDLMQHRERVAELRRKLPPGATVQDYVFQEGPAGRFKNLGTASVTILESRGCGKATQIDREFGHSMTRFAK